MTESRIKPWLTWATLRGFACGAAVYALILLVILILFVVFVFLGVFGRNSGVYAEYTFGVLKDALWTVQRPFAFVLVPLLFWRLCRRSRAFCVSLMLGDAAAFLLLLRLFPYHSLLP